MSQYTKTCFSAVANAALVSASQRVHDSCSTTFPGGFSP